MPSTAAQISALKSPKKIWCHHKRVMAQSEITLESLQGDIVKERVIVKFSATWCGPCVAIDPFVKKMCAKYSFRLIHVDIDMHPEISEAFGVSSIPHMLVCCDGDTRAVTGADTAGLEYVCATLSHGTKSVVVDTVNLPKL